MGVLLMLLTVGGVALAIVLLIVSVLTNSRWLRNFVLGSMAIWGIFYAAALIAFSLFSTERTLGLNEPKEFCGFYLDCHMHTAVTDVRKAKTIGDKRANGEFYIVKVKVFSNAKKATLGFGGLKLFALDAEGRRYPHAPEVEKPEPWFTRPVPAGTSFERDVVFDLPVDVSNPRLDMHDDKGWLEKFLIDDEDSAFHKRNYFDLSQPARTVAVQ
ncbi:MAG: DUF4352 domain-containing protein [Acidobacteria bacterium]|nr:DUF4352 domain-containing protein [Acidobacteriota bacterium]MCA1607865.1 DUF4352 domain-containing protein [Acidobacteriota bacterium]